MATKSRAKVPTYRRGRPGRRKGQAARLLSPDLKDFWPNVDVNVFGRAASPWLTFALLAKTGQHSKKSRQELTTYAQEFGSVAAKAFVRLDERFFRDITNLLTWVKQAATIPAADPLRLRLMLTYERLRCDKLSQLRAAYTAPWQKALAEWKERDLNGPRPKFGDFVKGTFDAAPANPTYHELHAAIEDCRELDEMAESQIRRMCREMGLKLRHPSRSVRAPRSLTVLRVPN